MYELLMLTYGIKPASYLATKCLQIIARSIRKEKPKVAKSIESEFYMDNFMSGAMTIKEALELYEAVHLLLQSFGFPLRKYQSNSSEFLNHIDSSLIEPLSSRILGSDSFVYVLGLVWYPETDTLGVLLDVESLSSDNITKRSMLSDISRVFDILGTYVSASSRKGQNSNARLVAKRACMGRFSSPRYKKLIVILS